MKVGFYQSDIFYKNIQKNIDKFYEKIKDLDFDLIVLSELFTTGYELNRAEFAELSENIPDGKTVEAFRKISGEKSASIIWGMAEKEDDKIYNSSVLVSSGNFIGKYRKIHLFLNEKNRFDSGSSGFPVWNVDGINIGMMICFDWIFPESARSLALKGADIIAHPANLVLPHCQKVIPARSIENGVFIITANRIGNEKELNFTGNSVITDYKGKYLLKGSKEDEEIEFVVINPKKARDKNITELNNIFEDRKPEYYEG